MSNDHFKPPQISAEKYDEILDAASEQLLGLANADDDCAHLQWWDSARATIDDIVKLLSFRRALIVFCEGSDDDGGEG